MVKTIYNQHKMVKMGKQVTPEFIVSSLFKIYIEEVIKHWKKKCKTMGIPTTDTTLYTLRFADDQVLPMTIKI